MPPLEYWFTSTTVTLWVAVLAATLSLWVAINGDWQAAVREQSRIESEQAIKKSREETLGAVLAVSGDADRLAYTQVADQAQYEAWKQKADEFWNAAKRRLKPALTPAEFANAFAPANPSAFMFGHALNDAHNEYVRRLTELAARLRNIALKYA
ncbi:hypothetical protein [Oricola nitratireducens]|uniref:hypothetical protein n=1 Tax=Oricola nitratireducens TaxID=2775868 RepID=UPI001866E264|nr:hypothetical protein [Oricola nitratireducens]